MTPVSIRNRTPSQTDAISRQFRAARLRSLFADVEAQLTDPTMIAMTREMRDTVMGSPEFAEEEGLSPAAVEWITRLQRGVPAHDLAFAFHIAGLTWAAGQELLEAGLVEKSRNGDGCTTYRLTQAGKAWRAAS